MEVVAHQAIHMFFGYPPDKQEKATQTVLEQAKLLCAEWAE
jgi:type I restriction enzyme R subunit